MYRNCKKLEKKNKSMHVYILYTCYFMYILFYIPPNAITMYFKG